MWRASSHRAHRAGRSPAGCTPAWAARWRPDGSRAAPPRDRRTGGGAERRGPDGPWRMSAAGRADASASAGNSPCAQRKPGRNAGHSLRVARRTHKVTAGAQEVVHRCPPFRTAG
ncbi:hypothetical protein J2S47_005550 [Streptomyces griseoviridis]|uniref:Uncharacterized protein n=1 Tax=Streptomyces griseoviridis TaxID=45398 RepID=A0ABT9LND8_STRGD|nr:hypothetical protein [Streptomyces griseoviridis]